MADSKYVQRAKKTRNPILEIKQNLSHIFISVCATTDLRANKKKMNHPTRQQNKKFFTLSQYCLINQLVANPKAFHFVKIKGEIPSACNWHD